MSQPEFSHARQLLDFCNRLRLGDVPADTTDLAKTLFLDTLGCGLFGAQQPWSKTLIEEMRRDDSTGVSTVLGDAGVELPAASAALCNGTSVHGFEQDDVIPRALIHPGTVILPAVLALAEAEGASGEDTLRSYIIGYEAMARISLAIGTGASSKGFHKTGIAGPVGAALACAALLGLDDDQTRFAMGIACSMAGGIKSFASGAGGGMVKRLHGGRAAEAGVRAASLARCGFTGPSTALDGRYGLIPVYSTDDGDPAQLSAGLGEQWIIDEVGTKLYPVCGGIQGPIQLILQLREEHGLKPGDIADIRVGTSAFAYNHNDNREPSDTMEAQYSLPYGVALAALADPTDPMAYQAPALDDKNVRELTRRIEMVVDSECDAVHPAQVACRLQLTLRDGTIRSAHTFDPKGSPGNPCNKDELQRKFALQARPSGIDTKAVTNVVNALDQVSDIRELSALLAVRN